MKPIYQQFNGIWYVGIDCGCGQFQWVELGAGSQLDASGVPISASDSGSDVVVPELDSGNVACYADKAIEYLLDRAIEWGHAIVDWSVQGADVFSPLDELYNTIQLIADLITGQDDVLPQIEQLTKQQITDAFSDADFRAKLKSKWTFTGKVNRAQLSLFFAQSTGVVGTLLGRGLFLQRWLQTSIISGYNNQLALLAAECSSGVQPPLALSPTLAVSNATYEIWRVQPSAENLIDLKYTGDLANVADLSALGANGTIVASGIVMRPLFSIPTGSGAQIMQIELRIDGSLALWAEAGTNRWIDGSLDFRYLGSGDQDALNYLNGISGQTFTAGFDDSNLDGDTPTGYPLDAGQLAFYVRATPESVKLRISDIYFIVDKS